jgi:hypothetical protein
MTRMERLAAALTRAGLAEIGWLDRQIVRVGARLLAPVERATGLPPDVWLRLRSGMPPELADRLDRWERRP